MNYIEYALMDESGQPMLKQLVNVVGGYRYHWHDTLEIQLIIVGECEICVEGAVYNLVEDDILIINSGCGHASLSHKGNCLSVVTHASYDYLRQLGLDPNKVRLYCNSAEESNRNASLFQSLRKNLCSCLVELQKESLSGNIAAKGYFELFLAQLLENYPLLKLDTKQRKKDEACQERVFAVIKYISRNYRRKISLEEVAQFTGYNRSYFSTFFKNAVGIGFQDYLTRYRLQSAIFELVNKEQSIADIALNNGFSDIKAFNQAFQHNFHKSPKEYRKNIGNMPFKPKTLERQLVEVDNPLVCDYLSRSLQEEKISQEESHHSPLQSVDVTLQADVAAMDFIHQLKTDGITLSLNVKKKSNPK